MVRRFLLNDTIYSIMKKTYKQPSIFVEQMLGSDAILLVNSLNTQEGKANPSVTPLDEIYDGGAASKENSWGDIWEK